MHFSMPAARQHESLFHAGSAQSGKGNASSSTPEGCAASETYLNGAQIQHGCLLGRTETTLKIMAVAVQNFG